MFWRESTGLFKSIWKYCMNLKVWIDWQLRTQIFENFEDWIKLHTSPNQSRLRARARARASQVNYGLTDRFGPRFLPRPRRAREFLQDLNRFVIRFAGGRGDRIIDLDGGGIENGGTESRVSSVIEDDEMPKFNGVVRHEVLPAFAQPNQAIVGSSELHFPVGAARKVDQRVSGERLSVSPQKLARNQLRQRYEQ